MRSVLLAVSGGIDSMYMANRASELFPGALFAVAHCNFALRGEDSDGDEAFVREWCLSKGVRCHAKRFRTTEYAQEKGISIEMAARELRYSWFAQLREEYSYEAVAVAHNANDNAETLILNLLRGTGSRGVRGMSSGRDGIIRPLLDTGREEITEWMTANGCLWREDRSNADTVYKRNLIRNKVFPLFAEINPSFVRTLNADMRRLAQADDIAQDYAQHAADTVRTEDGGISIPALTGLKHWEFVLWRMLEDYGMGRDEFESLTESLRTGRQTAGRRFGPVRGVYDRLVPDERREESRRLRYELLGRGELKSLRQDEGVIIADAGIIPVPPKVRPWRAGDWMRPLGMRGRKRYPT